MNPYSHLVLAAQLEADIRPADRLEYYWGAVAADVRYTAEARRVSRKKHCSKTPPPQETGYFHSNSKFENW